MRRSGFTILELLISLMTIAVVASVAIPFYFDRPDVTLENAEILLAKDLRAAQNRAAFLGEETTLEIFPDGDGYLVRDHRGVPVDHPRNELPFERRYSIDAVFRGVHITRVDFGGDRKLTFGPRGEPQEAVSLVLRYGNEERRVVVDPPYGHVTIVGSSSGWIDVGS